MTDELKHAREAENKYFAAVDAAAIADPLPEETVESLLDKIEHYSRDETPSRRLVQQFTKALRAKLNELSTAELQIEKLKRGKRQRQTYQLMTEDKFSGVGPTRRLLALSLVRNAVALVFSTVKETSFLNETKLVTDAMHELITQQANSFNPGAAMTRPDYGFGLASVALMLLAERSGVALYEAEVNSVNKLHAEIRAAASGRNSRQRPTDLLTWPVPLI